MLLAAPGGDFARVQLLETAGVDSAGVHAGDLNGDGLTDLVLAKGRHGPLHNRVLLNKGKGQFIASNLSETPDRTYSAALADLDGDGDLDIAVSNDMPDRKLIYLNDGRGRFREAGTFGEPKWSTRYVTLADLNRDGFPDLVVSNRQQPSFVCLNDRRAGFPACTKLPVESATSIVAADLDGDGALDLFVPHRDGGQSVALWNDGKGNFGASTAVGPKTASARIAVAADFNGDGVADLAWIEEQKKCAFVAYGRGARRFGEPVRLPGAERIPYALGTADLDGNGRPDLVVGYVRSPGSVYWNDGGRGDVKWREMLWNDGAGTVYGMAFVDLDGDKRLDIAAARSGAPNGIWFQTTQREP